MKVKISLRTLTCTIKMIGAAANMVSYFYRPVAKALCWESVSDVSEY